MPSGSRYVPVPGVPDYEGEPDDSADDAPAAEPAASPPTDAAATDPEPSAPASATPRPDAIASPDATPDDAETDAPPAPVSPPRPSAGEPLATGVSDATPDDVPASPGEPLAKPPRAEASTEAVAPVVVPRRDEAPGAEPGAPEAGSGGEPLASALPVVQTAKEAASERTKELVEIVTRYGRRHIPAPEPKTRVATEPPRLVGRLAQVLPFMKAIPVVLGVAFVASFAWDFPGAQVSLFGRVLPVEGLMRTLAVSGLIGYLTNWLAITMLFQPREKRAIIPQGLIPAQRERVIYRLAQAISKELINADIIKQRIQESGVIGRYRDLALGVVRGVVEDPGFRAELKDLAQGYATDVLGSEDVRRELGKLAAEKVEQQAGQGLGGVALRLYRTFAEDDFQRRIDRALRELPESVTPLLDRIDTALDGVPARVEARADEIEEAATRAVLSFVEGFDVQAMIMDKARGFDESQLENLLKSTSNEQLNYIKYLGGILGVLGGFVIWQPLLALGVFVTAGVALWGLDEALVRARR